MLDVQNASRTSLLYKKARNLISMGELIRFTKKKMDVWPLLRPGSQDRLEFATKRWKWNRMYITATDVWWFVMSMNTCCSARAGSLSCTLASIATSLSLVFLWTAVLYIDRLRLIHNGFNGGIDAHNKLYGHFIQ